MIRLALKKAEKPTIKPPIMKLILKRIFCNQFNLKKTHFAAIELYTIKVCSPPATTKDGSK
jgi:hypothetical protein